MKNNSLITAFDQSKKIAIVGAKGLPPEFPGTSGVEFYLSDRLLLLARLGIRVVCYVRTWATPANTTVYRRAVLIRFPSFATKHLDAVSHSFISTLHACFSSADAVWYQSTGPAMFSFLPRLFGKKVFVTIHTLEWKREKWGWLAKTALLGSEWIAARAAHKVFVVSRPLADYWKNTRHFQAIVDVPMALPAKKAPPNIIRTKYGLHAGGYVLYLGRFVPEKRIEWIIRAFRQVPGTNFRLVLAGGVHQLQDYKNKLTRLIQNDPRILLTGWVFGKEKEELLSNCRFFVLPSSVEGNPTVLYELPGDRPVLVSDRIARAVIRRKHVHVFAHLNYRQFADMFRALVRGDRMRHS